MVLNVFSSASSGTGRTRLLTNRRQKQSALLCLDARVHRRTGAESEALRGQGEELEASSLHWGWERK